MTNQPPHRRFWISIIALTLLGVVVDQITKAWAVAHLDPAHPVTVVPNLFQLTLLRNPGAAFSTGVGLTVVFAVVAMVVLVVVAVAVVPKVRCWSWTVALGLGLAGVAGNLIDRLVRPPGPFHGYVVDFFSLRYFAVFNVADVCLTTAAVLIVVICVFLRVDLAGRRTTVDRGNKD